MISRKMVLIVLSKVLISFGGLISIFLINTKYGPEGLGILAFSIAFVSTFSSSFGYDTAHYKIISTEEKKFDETLSSYILIKLINILVILILVLVSFYLYSSNISKESEKQMILIFLAVTIVSQLIIIPNTTLGSKLQTSKQQIPTIVGAIVRIMGIYFTVTFFNNIIFIGFAYLFAEIVALFLSVYYLNFTNFHFPKLRIIKAYSKFAFPMALTEFATQLFSRLDILMIKFFYGTSEVGYYFGPLRIVFSLMILPKAIGILFLPIFSKISNKENFNDLSYRLSEVIRNINVYSIPLIALITLFSKEILGAVFGDDFHKSILIFFIFLCSVYISLINKPIEIAILALNEPFKIGKIEIVTLIVGFILNIIFIPEILFGINLLGLGSVGAAFATLLTLVIRLSLTSLSLVRMNKVSLSLKHILQFTPLFPFIFCMIYFDLVQENLLNKCIFIFIFISAHFTFNLLTKQYTKSDFSLLLKTLNVKAFLSELRSDLSK